MLVGTMVEIGVKEAVLDLERHEDTAISRSSLAVHSFVIIDDPAYNWDTRIHKDDSETIDD